ncbi:Neurotactin [Nesidiocoris tenuis]|uniref:Neurotactin n=1 Tax=Nesidiocoris tenuis TaxID=355587 RepID=A0ABN7BCD4_9HEMI|nr:Neurotactin [Nesidiocoris tenuis]
MSEQTNEKDITQLESNEDKKSLDKLQIEDEERKTIMDPSKNGSDQKGVNGNDGPQTRGPGGEIEKKKKALEEAALTSGGGHRPIGGIKIPGFLKTSRSKDRSKDHGDGEEKADLLVETPCSDKINSPTSPDEKKNADTPSGLRLPPVLSNLKFSVPFFKRSTSQQDQSDGNVQSPPQEGGTDEPSRKPKLINAIRLPLASLVPKKLKSKDGDVEAGGGAQAGLASVETLDDADASKGQHDDGMENVKLDAVDGDAEKAALENEDESRWAKQDWRKWWDIAKEHKLTTFGIILFFVLLLILIIAVLSGPGVPTHAPIVDGKYIKAVTSCGYVEGLVENEEFVFRGIPFAKPPVNELRFKPPQRMTVDDCWNGTFKAHNVTPSCWQVFANNALDGSEDCLTLDVWTPYVRYDTPLPVLFLVGTDSLNGGWPSKLTVPSGLSKLKEIVIVRPRFRLSSLGFLASVSLSMTVHPRSSGNYGLADVIAALEWTSLNIQHFGGDSKSITVVGYRSGATLASLLTTIRKPEKLFARLWLSSGTAVFPNSSLVESENSYSSYVEAVGCSGKNDYENNADCLRNTDVEDLLENIPTDWKPQVEAGLPKESVQGHQWLVNDGHIVRQSPYLTWSSTNLSIPVVIGTTLHSEVTPDWYKIRADWTPERIRLEVDKSQIGIEKHTDKVLAIYNTTLVGLAAMISDISTVCPLYSMHKALAGSKFYLVTQPSDAAAKNGLVYGGADVEVLLGTYPYQTDPPQRRYITAMRNFFYRFVQNGVVPLHRMSVIGQDLTDQKMDPQDLEHRCTLWKEMGFDKFAKVG